METPGSGFPLISSTVALNCVPLSGVPPTMGAGVGQLTVGVAGVTTRLTLPVAVLKLVVSVGVKVTVSVCVPAVSSVPAGGVYTNVPGTVVAKPVETVAFNCVAESFVP